MKAFHLAQRGHNNPVFVQGVSAHAGAYAHVLPQT